MEIILQTFGSVPDETRLEIQNVLEECYHQLSPHGLEIVDVLLFKDSSRMEAHAAEHHDALGVQSYGFEANFVAMHEAWTGIPRILICHERLHQLSPLLRAAILRHEAAHSVLHGSPEYYIFSIPGSLLEAAQKYGFPRIFTTNILYLTSIGVKDYEVTKLLLDHRFIEDQKSYAQFVSRTDHDDLEAWNLSKGDPKKKLLCLVGRFKDLACLAAATSQHGWKNLEDKPIEKELVYLPVDIRKKLLELSWSLRETNSYDTFAKVEYSANLVVSKLIEPLFSNSVDRK